MKIVSTTNYVILSFLIILSVFIVFLIALCLYNVKKSHTKDEIFFSYASLICLVIIVIFGCVNIYTDNSYTYYPIKEYYVSESISIKLKEDLIYERVEEDTSREYPNEIGEKVHFNNTNYNVLKKGTPLDIKIVSKKYPNIKEKELDKNDFKVFWVNGNELIEIPNQKVVNEGIDKIVQKFVWFINIKGY